MNRNKIQFLLLLLSFSVVFLPLSAQRMAATSAAAPFLKNSAIAPLLPADDYIANFSISHGHCQLPLEARFTDVKINWGESLSDGLKIDFDISTHSIVAIGEESGEWTQKMRSPASFDPGRHPTMSFVSKDSYHIGKDWYQVNGTLTIKGKSLPASFHARPVFDHAGCGRTVQKIVVNGDVNLKDYGVSEGNAGGEDELLRRMYMNFVVKADGC